MIGEVRYSDESANAASSRPPNALDEAIARVRSIRENTLGMGERLSSVTDRLFGTCAKPCETTDGAKEGVPYDGQIGELLSAIIHLEETARGLSGEVSRLSQHVG